VYTPESEVTVSKHQYSITSNFTGSDSFICSSPYFRFLTVTATNT